MSDEFSQLNSFLKNVIPSFIPSKCRQLCDDLSEEEIRDLHSRLNRDGALPVASELPVRAAKVLLMYARAQDAFDVIAIKEAFTDIQRRDKAKLLAVPNPNQNHTPTVASTPKKYSKILGLLCVKSHESKAMQAILLHKHKRIEEEKWHAGAMFFTVQFELNTALVILFSFGEHQGPITCAVRLELVIQHCERQNIPLSALMMVGICGGLKLGQVIIADHTTGLDLGSRIWDQSLQAYKDEHKDFSQTIPGDYGKNWTKKIISTFHGKVFQIVSGLDNNLMADKFSKSESVTIDIVEGEMLCVTKVRDDAFLLINDFKQMKKNANFGVEMESYPFFFLGNLHKINLLPVIKGTSDAGWEAFENGDHKEHNISEMKKVFPGFVVRNNGQVLDSSAARKVYRPLAAANAAAVAYQYILLWEQSN